MTLANRAIERCTKYIEQTYASSFDYGMDRWKEFMIDDVIVDCRIIHDEDTDEISISVYAVDYKDSNKPIKTFLDYTSKPIEEFFTG